MPDNHAQVITSVALVYYGSNRQIKPTARHESKAESNAFPQHTGSIDAWHPRALGLVELEAQLLTLAAAPQVGEAHRGQPFRQNQQPSVNFLSDPKP